MDLAEHAGMAISPDGRWLYLLKTNYSAGSSEYSLLTFDTRESRFVSGEQPISNCPGPHPLPVPGDVRVLVLCAGGTAVQTSDGDLVLRLPNFQNFALGRGSNGHSLYMATLDGRIKALDVGTHVVGRTSKDAFSRHRRIMPSSGTMSPDGRLWYLPIKIPDNGEQEIEQILVFDTQAMSMAHIITPVGPFWGLALSSDGRRLYASQPDLQNILVIDTGTRRTIRTIAVGTKPSIIFAAKAP
jgi:YVTN family beta-propeller protein